MADLLTVAGVDPTGRATGSTGLVEVSTGTPVGTDTPGTKDADRSSTGRDDRRRPGRELRNAGAPRNT